MPRTKARPTPILILLLCALAGCSARSAGDDLPQAAPDIRGTVTKADVAAEPRQILVEENPGETSGSNKASVTLTAETRVLRRVGEGVEPAAPEDLAVGRTVSVWFSGPVRESFPVQATAGTVLIEGR